MSAYRYKLHEILGILWTASSIMLVASVIMITVFPEQGITIDQYSLDTDYENAWRGIFDNKNSLGSVMMWATMTFIYCARSSGYGIFF